MTRRDSWEDSKTSVEVEKDDDFVEEKRLGGDLVGVTDREEEDDDEDDGNDVAINDEDFGDTSHDDSGRDDVEMCSDDDDDDDDESEDEFILTKPLMSEVRTLRTQGI